MENNIRIRRAKEAHEEKNKILMVAIVPAPPFPGPAPGDRAGGAFYLSVLSRRHDSTLFVGGWKMHSINACSTLLKLMPLFP